MEGWDNVTFKKIDETIFTKDKDFKEYTEKWGFTQFHVTQFSYTGTLPFFQLNIPSQKLQFCQNFFNNAEVKTKFEYFDIMTQKWKPISEALPENFDFTSSLAKGIPFTVQATSMNDLQPLYHYNLVHKKTNALVKCPDFYFSSYNNDAVEDITIGDKVRVLMWKLWEVQHHLINEYTYDLQKQEKEKQETDSDKSEDNNPVDSLDINTIDEDSGSQAKKDKQEEEIDDSAILEVVKSSTFDEGIADMLAEQLFEQKNAKMSENTFGKGRFELLLHLMKVFMIGGGVMNQYEDDFTVYSEFIKKMYKCVVSVRKNPLSGELEVVSSAVDCSAFQFLFPGNRSRLNTCYIVIDPIKKIVTCLYNSFGQ